MSVGKQSTVVAVQPCGWTVNDVGFNIFWGRFLTLNFGGGGGKVSLVAFKRATWWRYRGGVICCGYAV